MSEKTFSDKDKLPGREQKFAEMMEDATISMNIPEVVMLLHGIHMAMSVRVSLEEEGDEVVEKTPHCTFCGQAIQMPPTPDGYSLATAKQVAEQHGMMALTNGDKEPCFVAALYMRMWNAVLEQRQRMNQIEKAGRAVDLDDE